MRITELFVDGLVAPLGIDNPKPAFSWRFGESTTRGLRQKAYRILASTDPDSLAPGKATVWDSGVVHSRRSVNAPYGGPPLASRQRCYWTVAVLDQNDRWVFGPTSWWEMGLLEPDDWQARWIGRGAPSAQGDEHRAWMLRREFSLAGDIRRARAYVCGLGHFELSINGRRTGDALLEPGWTHYDKSCLYVAYDIADYVRPGDNAVGLLLGNGFFNVAGNRYKKFKDSFGLPKAIVQIEVEFADGAVATVASDESWRLSASPITFSCIYGGEDYDARLERPGWDEPDFAADDRWEPAALVDPPKGRLKAQAIPPIKVMRRFQPAAVTNPLPGVYVVDMGQNFSGIFEIAVHGEPGSVVKITPAELLKKDGTVNQRHTGSPHTYAYTLKGEGVETWSPRFTYYGYRYLQVEGAVPRALTDGDAPGPVLEAVEGHMIHPDFETSGSFECSDPLVNRIHELINWAILSNAKSVFTDCPHREKLGWLEQVHLMGPSVTYNYQVEALLAKIMDDMREAQQPNGMIPTTAPEYVVFQPPWDFFRDCVSWGAAYILTPLLMFERCGNVRMMEEHYETMKKYMAYLERCADGGIIERGLGDWYDAGEEPPGLSQLTPVGLPETAMYFHLAQAFSKIAELLGRDDDQAAFAELSHKIKDAFNARYFDAESGAYATGSQTANAMPLALGLVEEEQRERVFANLVADIVRRDGHTTAGDVGHRYVLLALSAHGRDDLIEAMASKTGHPSYGYQVKHGATSLTEAWDGPTVGKSQNHFMLGHIEEWFYHRLAGLGFAFDPKTEAYRVTVRPYIAKAWRRAGASHVLLVGKASASWEKLDRGGVALDVEIPVNAQGEIVVPAAWLNDLRESGRPVQDVAEIEIVDGGQDEARLLVPAGAYHFESAGVDE